MIISLHPCVDADVQIILGDRLLRQNEILLLKKADAIILPQACSRQLYDICSQSGALLFPEYKWRFRYPGKIGQIKLFDKIGISYPCSICYPDIALIKKNYKKLIKKVPFILKKSSSHEGYGVFVIREISEIEDIISKIKGEGIIAQELIECGGNVLRVVIIGDKLISYWKRPAIPGEIITTINRNALIDHNWRPGLQRRGKALVQRLISKTGINLAAVDILFKEWKYPVILEINYYFGRKGLGGSEKYYFLLFDAIKRWLSAHQINSGSVRLSF